MRPPYELICNQKWYFSTLDPENTENANSWSSAPVPSSLICVPSHSAYVVSLAVGGNGVLGCRLAIMARHVRLLPIFSA